MEEEKAVKVNYNLARTAAAAAVLGVAYFIYLLTATLAGAAVFLVLLCLYIAGIAVLFSKKKLPEHILPKLAIFEMSALSILMAFTFFDLTYLFVILVVISIIFFYTKQFHLRDVAKILFMFAVLFVAASTLFQPAVAISRDQGTVLSDNWWNSLNWIKNNTAECAVIATYWDPGHFITGIANRPVVFDGASQNDVWSKTVEPGLTYEEMRQIAGTDKFITRNITVNGTQKTVIETARIQDIATTLSTSNETQALEILKKYQKPGCDEMYFIASSDLIGKSYWWTYFSTWNPIDKGCATPMSQLELKQVKPATGGGATYTFAGGIPMGCNQQVGGQVIVTVQNDSINAYVLQNNKLDAVEKFFYYTNQGGILRTQPDAPAKGMVWLDPSGQGMIYIPQEIDDAIFTKMFFFNGQGLNYFEYVNESSKWGGEVKLFKVRFDKLQQASNGQQAAAPTQPASNATV